jgi:putative transposase
MLTLEFKLSLTTCQEQRLDAWLRDMSWVHNSALACIESFNAHNAYHKEDKRSYACNPIVSYWRGQVYPSCPIGHQLAQFDEESYAIALLERKNKKGTVYPLQAWAGEPRLENVSYFSLIKRFSKKLHPVKLADVPSKFVSGRVERVALSWQAFLKGNAKPPKFKSRRNPVMSLIHNNSKDVRIDGDRINVPRIGWLKAKGLTKRWPQGVPFCPMKVIKAADGWYLQLTGEVGERKPLKQTGRHVGIDPGSVRHHTTDSGSFVEPPRYLLKAAKKLRMLQRQLSRQYRQNSTQVFGKDGRVIRSVARSDWDRKNFDKTKAKIAKLHAKIARQRRAFNHFQSSKYAAMFDVITVEDFEPAKLTRAVKKGEAGVRNGRKAKSGLNRNLLDNAIGQFYGMLEQKSKDRGRLFQRVKPAFSSQTCNCCGYRSKDNRQSQSSFVCLSCGHRDNADRNAARNIKRMAELGIDRLTFTDDFADGFRERMGVDGAKDVVSLPKKAKKRGSRKSTMEVPCQLTLDEGMFK